MIKDFVNAWDKYKSNLEKKYNKKLPSCYSEIVIDVIETVINPYLNEIDKCELNADRITTIDDGDYQGELLYILPDYTYQPKITDYYITNVYYGSCSQCDTFEGICASKNKKSKVDGFMTLALHILQSFRKIVEEEEL